MGKDTGIEWCHHTFNPWWGCQRVDAACERCYAETFAIRLGLKIWGPTADHRLFADKHWAEPLAWQRAAAAAGERRRVFCASMADVFEDRRDLDVQRARLWALIAATPSLDWLLLTKRPRNMLSLAPAAWAAGWPPNVWAGTTVGDRRALTRLDDLRAVPAALRFVSFEPLLEDLGDVDLTGIAWCILGGESGAGARPCALEWLERLALQVRRAGAATFVKQLGAYVVSEQRTMAVADFEAATGHRPDKPEHFAPSGEVWAWRAGLTDAKGGDLDQFPDSLRVREFPR